MDGTNTLDTGTLSVVNGQTQATFTTSTLPSGNQTIVAIYGGDDTFMGSSAILTQTVGQATLFNSSTTVSSSSSSATPGQAVTFTATVNGEGGATAAGTVTFLDGTTVLGTASLSVVNGQDQATFTTSTLLLGIHDILAVYSGDGEHYNSASSLTQSIVPLGTSTSLSSSANPSPLGQPLTFTAVVAWNGMGAPPTGNVSFYDGTILLGTGTLTLVNGQMQASFTTSAMGLGSHAIIAVYSGDSTFAGSGSSLEEYVN